MGYQDLITPSEAALILGVSRMRVHQLIREGKITVIHTIGAQNIKLLDKAKVKRLQKAREKG